MSICVKAVQNFLSLPLIKQTALGVTVGLIDAYMSMELVSPLCSKTNSTLSDYYCLRAAKFFEPSRLAFFLNPLINLKLSMSKFVEHYVPDFIPMDLTYDCEVLTLPLAHLKRFERFIPSGGQPPKEYLASIEYYQDIYLGCCTNRTNSSYEIAGAFVEELIFRVIIQKIALVAISKLFSGRTRAFLSHSATRIMIASTIFALAHDRPNYLWQFIGGLTYGFMFENCRYGLLLSTVSHAMSNIFRYNLYRNGLCNKAMREAATLSIELFEKTQHFFSSEKAS